MVARSQAFIVLVAAPVCEVPRVKLGGEKEGDEWQSR